jgi:hypothetical protein
MYSAAALLPSSLPRSEILTSRPPTLAGEAPVSLARCSRMEASSIPAAGASATSAGSGVEDSWAVRALVSGASPGIPPSDPQPRSAQTTSAQTRSAPGVIFGPSLILCTPPPTLVAGIISEGRAMHRRRIPPPALGDNLPKPTARAACGLHAAYDCLARTAREGTVGWRPRLPS